MCDVRSVYVRICNVLYCIVFIILIDIQRKICSCTIFHIVYLRNINQFEICMLLFMLNNESFSYSISFAHASNPLFDCTFSVQYTHQMRAHTHTHSSVHSIVIMDVCACVCILYVVCVTQYGRFISCRTLNLLFIICCMNE